MSSRRSSVPSRLSRDAALSGRRDRKRLKERAAKEANRAARFRSSSIGTRQFVSDADSDVIVPVHPNDAEVILAQPYRAADAGSSVTGDLGGDQSDDSDARSYQSASTAASRRSRRTDTSRERADRRVKAADERRGKRRRRKVQKEAVLPTEPSLHVYGGGREGITSPPELRPQVEPQNVVYEEAAAVGAPPVDGRSSSSIGKTLSTSSSQTSKKSCRAALMCASFQSGPIGCHQRPNMSLSRTPFVVRPM